MSNEKPDRILLLQAREPGDPILEHELDCFVEQTDVDREAFRAVNMPETALGPELLEGIDMVTVGGAGDFSVASGGYDWYGEMLDLMRGVVDRGVPMFASCFGCHALVAALGGELETDPDQEEVGTFGIRLTREGRRDPLFGELGDEFRAQLGHKDSVVELPQGLVRLAESDRCAVQAVRVPGAPIVATQFHPELTHEDNIERYVRYIQNYKGIEETREEALERARRVHEPSPVSNELLRLFIDRTFR